MGGEILKVESLGVFCTHLTSTTTWPPQTGYVKKHLTSITTWPPQQDMTNRIWWYHFVLNLHSSVILTNRVWTTGYDKPNVYDMIFVVNLHPSVILKNRVWQCITRRGVWVDWLHDTFICWQCNSIIMVVSFCTQCDYDYA